MTILDARAVLERAASLTNRDWEVLFGLFVPYGMEHLREPNRLAHLAGSTKADNAAEWNDFYDGEFLPTLRRARSPEYAERIIGPVLVGEFNREHISGETYAALTRWWFDALEPRMPWPLRRGAGARMDAESVGGAGQEVGQDDADRGRGSGRCDSGARDRASPGWMRED